MSGGEGLEAIFLMLAASHFEMCPDETNKPKTTKLTGKRLKSIDHAVTRNHSNFDSKG